MTPIKLIIFSFLLLCCVCSEANPLRRGINVSGYFVKGNVPSFKPETAVLLSRLGFDHVRLNIDPGYFLEGSATGALNSTSLHSLDNVVRVLKQHQLRIVIDIHAPAYYQKPLFSDNSAFEKFLKFYRSLAEHLAQFPDSKSWILFGTLNEPGLANYEHWDELQQRIVNVLRSVAVDNFILLSAPAGGQADALIKMRPITAPNLIYDFHFYRPGIFTHQGANYAVDYFEFLKGIPYPFGPGQSSSILKQIKTGPGRKHFIETYSTTMWDEKKLGSLIGEVLAWAAKNKVEIVCEEFGVRKKGSDPASRARWLSDVRKILERHKIGWAMWDLDGEFGLLEKEHPSNEIEGLLIEALGLAQIKSK